MWGDAGRTVKEDMLRFDGTRLFPERRAYTTNYKLSDIEAALYAAVTDYVKEEMNRADQLDGLITMQCGPIRHEIEQAVHGTRRLIVHDTVFTTGSDGRAWPGRQPMTGCRRLQR